MVPAISQRHFCQMIYGKALSKCTPLVCLRRRPWSGNCLLEGFSVESEPSFQSSSPNSWFVAFETLPCQQRWKVTIDSRYWQFLAGFVHVTKNKFLNSRRSSIFFSARRAEKHSNNKQKLKYIIFLSGTYLLRFQSVTCGLLILLSSLCPSLSIANHPKYCFLLCTSDLSPTLPLEMKASALFIFLALGKHNIVSYPWWKELNKYLSVQKKPNT